MDSILIQTEGSSMSFIDRDGFLVYSISNTYNRQDSRWLSTIQRLNNSEDSEKPSVVLASVLYIGYSTTTVDFQCRSLDLDTFLPRQNSHSNSRVFIGPDGQAYVWNIDGRNLELRHVDSHTLIARSHPHKEPTLFSPKPRPAFIELLPEYGLDSDNPQMLDAIIITYSIMQRKLNERRQYRFPC
ncbi:hypothetical protein Clacol_008598 [Clathrus columnatus]|uniref:DUF6593 domain-containing protein n=1 Tax=Clathrus columnatus TaxID=1419009 RepID=A0AAV5ANU1_9AGAM|nr:hypothetical protein Clacol_008598 [Clathrus columnatus]